MTIAREMDLHRGGRRVRREDGRWLERVAAAALGFSKTLTPGGLGRRIGRIRDKAEGQNGAGRRYGGYWWSSANSLFTVRVEPDGGFVFEGINPAHEAKTGLRQSDLAGRRPEEALPPETAVLVTAHYRACVERGRPITYVETLDLPAGRRHWETTLTPMRGAGGRIEMLLGSCQDITERVAAERALAESEERFRGIAELAPDILFTASLDGGPDYLSPSYYAYTGLPASVRSRDALEVVHPDDRARLTPDLEEVRRQGSNTEVRIRRHDGVYRWFLLRIAIGEGPGGQQLFGVAADIDDVKRASAEILALNQRLTGILSSISDCYYTLDRNWRMTGVNRRAAEWFRQSEAKLIGSDVRPRLHHKRDLVAAIAEAFETGQSTRLERPSQVYPGQWIELHVYPTPDGASVFFHEITERREAQAAIEDATDLLQGSLDAMSAEIALLDEACTIIAVNKAWRDGAGGQGRADHGVASSYLELCRRMIPDVDEVKVARGLRALLNGQRQTFSMAYMLTTPQGVRWRQLRINRFQHGQATRLIAQHEDVTEIAVAQAELKETSRRLLSIQEEERGRIAVELHDSTSQHLVALGMGVARLRRTLDSGPAVEPVLNDMAGSIGEAMKEIRVLSYLLNPPNLERDGLVLTARRFVLGFGGRSGLNAIFRAEGRLDDIGPEIQRAAFRVIQEALSNVHRHAEAAGVEVELSQRGKLLVLRIADDGRGIRDPEGVSEAGGQLGVGIPGMRARVGQLGGMLSISGDAAGTVVEATIPIPVAESRSFRPNLSRQNPTTGAGPALGATA